MWVQNLKIITSHIAVGGSPEITSLHFISLLTTVPRNPTSGAKRRRLPWAEVLSHYQATRLFRQPSSANPLWANGAGAWEAVGRGRGGPSSQLNCEAALEDGPKNPWLLVLTCVIPSLKHGPGLETHIQQRENSKSEGISLPILCCKTVTSVLLALSLAFLACFHEDRCHVVSCPEDSSMEQGTECGLQLTAMSN